jgi:signal transduction histidine kinase
MAARGHTILIVDDEPFFREEVVAYLQAPAFAERGWRAEVATCGADALARLDQGGCDVMLLDINMPAMDGMEVLSRMQERRLLDQTYVTMLSAYGVYENVIAAMRGGAKDFVNKSEPLDQWVLRIERGLEWQELRRRKQEAEDELRLLAREVGHDIGGTTYFVLTQRVRALARLVADDAEGMRSIEVIDQILARTKRLADDLGYVAVALDSSEMWRWEELDLTRMLERLLQEFQYGYPAVTVVRAWDSLLPHILGSRAQLERSLYNVLNNAGRAMPDGGTLTVRTRCDGSDWVAVDFVDSGVGVLPEIRDQIFRIGVSGWRGGRQGSGLGLYITRRNVENHGGRIEVASATGQGTTMSIYLPVRTNEQA